LFPRSTITVIYFFFFIGTLEIPSLWFIGLFFAKDLLGFSGQGGNVAHNAHVFGTLFGVGVCFVLLSAHLLPRDQFDVLALVSRWNKRRQYRDLVTKGYNPFDYAGGASRGGGNGKHPPPLDPAALRVAELRGAVSDAVSKHDLPRAGQLYLELKALDPAQVLPRQSQLDVANHLAGQQLYAEAAGAYEQFLAAYPKYEQVEQVQLMLGLIYARYLEQYAKAKEHLARALTRLHGQRETELAQAELARIEPMAGTGAPAR
jgi:tetratricopeptide (TPR) repeat protein